MKKEMLEKMVEGCEEEIRKEVVRRVSEAFTQDVSNQVYQKLTKEVGEFLDKEIMPELQVYLTSNKGPILAGAKKAADTLSTSIETAIVAQVNEAMKESWKRSNVLKALFGS